MPPAILTVTPSSDAMHSPQALQLENSTNKPRPKQPQYQTNEQPQLQKGSQNSLSLLSSISINQRVLSVQWFVLGLSCFIVLYVALFLGFHSTLKMSITSEGGSVPVIVESSVATILPIMALGQFYTTVFYQFRFCGQSMGKLEKFTTEHGKIAIKRAAYPPILKTSLIVFIPLFALIELTTFSPLFFNLELPSLIVFIVIKEKLYTIGIEQALKEMGAITEERKSERRDSLRRVSLRRASEVLIGAQENEIDFSTSKKDRKAGNIKRIFAIVLNLLMLIGYPFTVITLFRSVGVIGRMLVVLFLHPLIMEFVMHGYRASTGRSRNLLGEEVELEPLRDMVGIFIMER